MDGCRITVCMPTYNGEKYIRRQLETILSQLGQEDEVVVSDDSSSDSTLAIVESFNDKRIRIFRDNKYHSAKNNMENALKQARGMYIFLADQDDVWMEGKVSQMMNLLENYDLVVSDAIVVDANENVIHDSLMSLLNSGKGMLKNFVKNTYVGCCMAFRRDLLKVVLPFPSNIPMHDNWIGLCSECKRKRIVFSDKPLILYRRHGDNASTCSTKGNRPVYIRIKDRWNLFVSLSSRFVWKTNGTDV